MVVGRDRAELMGSRGLLDPAEPDSQSLSCHA